jgi:hypothetical protein
MKRKNKFDTKTEEQAYCKENLELIAKPSCKKCYGTGYIGTNRLTNKIVICKCALKNLKEYQVKKIIQQHEEIRSQKEKQHE